MTAETEQQDTVTFLTNPATYGATSVERLSTHGAHVFLAGDKAYKLKRAVKYSFMDFSTVEKRRAMLETELDINRRTAPDLYLEVRGICRDSGGRIRFGTDAPVLDWVLVMRRFDQDAMLDGMARKGSLDVSAMNTLAEEITAMHGKAPVVHRAEAEYFARTAMNVAGSLEAIESSRDAVRTFQRLIREKCAEARDHLKRRAEQGFVRRCHGDLHLRNIVMWEGRPLPFDALEFDSALATGDVYYDLAFLLMDLEHRGLRGHANRLLNVYAGITDDLEGLKALPLFMAVRAAVRAEVSLLSAQGETVMGKQEAFMKECSAYIELALSYLEPPPPRLVCIGGFSGTGKSAVAQSVAAEIAPRPGALVWRSDVLRKRLAGVNEIAKLPRGAYTPGNNARVYASLADHARRTLSAGHSVIADAVFSEPPERSMMERLAEDLGVTFHGLWLSAPLKVRLDRIGGRRLDASDADTAVAEGQEGYDIGPVSWHEIDATAALEEVSAEVLTALGP